MVRLKGLEPLAYWFVASHSIQLSYRRTYRVFVPRGTEFVRLTAGLSTRPNCRYTYPTSVCRFTSDN